MRTGALGTRRYERGARGWVTGRFARGVDAVTVAGFVSLPELEQPGGPASPPSRIARSLVGLLRGSEPESVVRLRLPNGPESRTAEVLEGLHAVEELPLGNGDLRACFLSLISPREKPVKDAIGRLRAMLDRQYAEILRHDVGVRLDLDAEDVHRLRVAARRAPAVLRAARPVLDQEWSEPLRAELKWLGGTLGQRRDLDVLLARLAGEIHPPWVTDLGLNGYWQHDR